MPFERHAAMPTALVSGKFLPHVGAQVYAWRVRTGSCPSWHTCTVIRTAPENVELWDETLEQWFCFDPRGSALPDVRMQRSGCKEAS